MFKEKLGSMWYLLQVHTEGDFQGAQYVIIHMTTQFLEEVKYLRKTIETIKEEISFVWCIDVFDLRAMFVTRSCDCELEDGELLTSEQSDELYEITNDGKGVWEIEDPGEEINKLRVEGSVLKVTDHGVSFNAYIKHTAMLNSTETVSYARMGL